MCYLRNIKQNLFSFKTLYYFKYITKDFQQIEFTDSFNFNERSVSNLGYFKHVPWVINTHNSSTIVDNSPAKIKSGFN